MKIIEAINKIDDLKPNDYDQSDKVVWLSRLDAMVKNQVIDTHEGGEGVNFSGSDVETDLETELLIPEPYDEAYIRWLEAQIDYTNGEYAKYNNSIEMFNASWKGYQNHYNRTHMPRGCGMRFF